MPSFFSTTSSSSNVWLSSSSFLFEAMRSHSLSLYFHPHYRKRRPPSSPIGLLQSPRIFSAPARFRSSINYSFSKSFYGVQLSAFNFRAYGFKFRRSAFDQDFDILSLDDYDWGENVATVGYILSSSDGEDSDSEIILNPVSDTDLSGVSVSSNDALSASTHRLAMLGRGSRKHKIWHGVFINMGLIFFLVVLLSYVDWCAWRIVHLPLDPFHLTRPFFMSAILASFAGYICVPLFHSLNLYKIIRKEGPARHYLKRKTPSLGGLFFVPVGLIVTQFLVGFSSSEVSGAVGATLAFAAIGLLDDILSLIKDHNYGLSPWIKILLEVAVGIWFSFWLNVTSISTPYSMKMIVPVPAPLGLVYIGKYYSLLTSCCFVSMGNGVNLTDGLDGLAGGTAALAFIGMAIAVLPISSDLAIFGASMGGACVGFLLHNRYKASVFMGETGSMALGGALAAMAACSGMFFPLLISSGVFVLEASSVIIQVLCLKTTEHCKGKGRSLFRMVPFHHHLELCGIKEPFIVAGAYTISSVLALLAGYIGLVSA